MFCEQQISLFWSIIVSFDFLLRVTTYRVLQFLRYFDQSGVLTEIPSWTVGPGGPTLIVSDADIVTEIAHRWKDFSKQTKPYRSLAVFGPNVVTSEGSTWQRHRKITSPPFNEKNSRYVFPLRFLSLLTSLVSSLQTVLLMAKR
jgi:hypothetical protein